MRTVHYWKKAGPSAAPSNILCVDTETWHGDKVEKNGSEYHTLRIGVAKAFRLEKGHRTRERSLCFTEASSFWELFRERLDRRRPLWVYGHNLAYDLGILGGWQFLSSDMVRVFKCVIDGPLFFVKGECDGKPFWFCDTFNYFRCPLEKIGKAIGVCKPDLPQQEDVDAVWYDRCEADVEIVARAITSLVAYGKEVGLGPWQPTVAGQAFACYRSRYMNHKVLVHTNAPALKLEREAYYGGIVDCQFIGEKRSVYELDVCSMYPYVCCKTLPIRIKGFSERIGPVVLDKLMRDYLCFADVTVSTEKDTYPVRVNKRVYYPVGQYRTCLAHPELVYALENNHVRYIHSVSWHQGEEIFRPFMEDLVSQKEAFRSQDPPNEAFAEVAKMLVTNLYGKTGQMTPTWVPWCPETFAAIEEMNGLKPGTLDIHCRNPLHMEEFECDYSIIEHNIDLKVRNLYGTVELQIAERESRDSVPAIAAMVTSYARVWLRLLQRTAGDGHWYYSDTDSLWCSREGYQRLHDVGYVRKATIGMLDCKAAHDYVRFHGYKDYETAGVVKLKGIRRPRESQLGDGYKQLHFPSAKCQLKQGTNGVVIVRRLVKRPTRKVERVTVLPSGWTKPLVFPDALKNLVKSRNYA